MLDSEIEQLVYGDHPEEHFDVAEKHVLECDVCFNSLRTRMQSGDPMADHVRGLSADATPMPDGVEQLMPKLLALCPRSTKRSTERSGEAKPIIAFRCASRQKKLSVKQSAIGKKVKCPGCGNLTLVARHGRHRPGVAKRHADDCAEPLRGMKLTVFHGPGPQSELTDLTPLEGMPLEEINLWDCQRIVDLAPLKGMQLKSLNLTFARNLTDPSPLKGMSLEKLSISGTDVANLSLIEGKRLKHLDLNQCKATSSSLLRGMPLEWLDISGLTVKDFSVIKGMPLTEFYAAMTSLNDLSLLSDAKLTKLVVFGSPISDLSPLKGMPLEKLDIDGTNVACAVSPSRIFR